MIITILIEALLYFKKAFALNPDDKELENKIISLQKNSQNSPSEVKKQNEITNKEKAQEKISAITGFKKRSR